MSYDSAADDYARLNAAVRLAAARIGALTGARAATDTPTVVLVRPTTAPAAPAADWSMSITWTALDWVLVPVALVLAAARTPGTHRRDRHAVHRRGVWMRGTARPATAPDARGTWRSTAPPTAGWITRTGGTR